MMTIEGLKAAILWAEKKGHDAEAAADSSPFGGEGSAGFEKEAQYLRTAAACMWEKLERLESEAQV